MTDLNTLRVLSDRAAPGEFTAYSEPDVGMPATLFSGSIGTGDFCPVEPLSPADVYFIAAAVNYVRSVLAR